MLRTIIAVAVVFSALTTISAQNYEYVSPSRVHHFNKDNFLSLTYGKTAPTQTATTVAKSATIQTISSISAEYAKILRETRKSASEYLEARAMRNATAKKPAYNMQALLTVCRDYNLAKEFAYGNYSTREIVNQEIETREAKEDIQPVEFAGND